MVDTKDLKSFAFGRAGSSPALGTIDRIQKTKYKVQNEGNFDLDSFMRLRNLVDSSTLSYGLSHPSFYCSRSWTHNVGSDLGSFSFI